MAVVAETAPYARPGGLAGAFLEPGRRRHPAPGALLAGGLVVLAGGDGVAGVVALIVFAGAVVALAARRIGGFTGDVLGAAGIIGETAGLLAAAARW
jgi:adenosylcobinamide-GDP ribazoletransferase